MKKAKKLVAVLLAIATLFTIFATSASALEKGDYVEWFSNNGSDVYYYVFAGTLNEGSNVTEVAEKLNYTSIYTFSRAFRNKFGVSPTHYQKKLSIPSEKQKI